MIKHELFNQPTTTEINEDFRFAVGFPNLQGAKNIKWKHFKEQIAKDFNAPFLPAYVTRLPHAVAQIQIQSNNPSKAELQAVFGLEPISFTAIILDTNTLKSISIPIRCD